MFPIYLAADLTDASLVQSRLKDAGIRCGVRNEFLQGALGELPVTLRPEIYVYSEKDVARARECVRQWEALLHAETPEEVRCAKCGDLSPGNFELCWKCGADLSA